MPVPDSCILVIFGASGDLTKKKLLPALFELHRQKQLPEKFAVLGIGRSRLTNEAFRAGTVQALASDDRKCMEEFCSMLHYVSIDTANVLEYATVRSRLIALDADYHIGGNYVYYLATPPSLYATVAHGLASQELNFQREGKEWRRIVVEKPFGRDLGSAEALNRQLQGYFQESQIYRIDHYLGKETVQNIMALRFSNGMFEPLWNRNYVDRVEITAAENIGIENRGGYYEQAGILRDMVQNHLLQVTGIVAMEPPSNFNATAVRNEVVKVMQALRPMKKEEVLGAVVRGQYVESVVRGESIAGYRQEKDVAPDSRIETFVAMKFFIDNWRWGGVPFYIRTGKRLPTRVTEAVIHFKKTPHMLFSNSGQSVPAANQLVIRIQPDEGVLIKFGMKVPGAGFDIQTVNMDFHYSELSQTYVPSAYERLLLDCMLGDATLYARSDAVEACWAFVQPILTAWEEHPEEKLYGYPAGTWGPKEASDLFGSAEVDWRYPCKNLSDDGIYCEL